MRAGIEKWGCKSRVRWRSVELQLGPGWLTIWKIRAMCSPRGWRTRATRVCKDKSWRDETQQRNVAIGDALSLRSEQWKCGLGFARWRFTYLKVAWELFLSLLQANFWSWCKSMMGVKNTDEWRGTNPKVDSWDSSYNEDEMKLMGKHAVGFNPLAIDQYLILLQTEQSTFVCILLTEAFTSKATKTVYQSPLRQEWRLLSRVCLTHINIYIYTRTYKHVHTNTLNYLLSVWQYVIVIVCVYICKNVFLNGTKSFGNMVIEFHVMWLPALLQTGGGDGSQWSFMARLSGCA